MIDQLAVARELAGMAEEDGSDLAHVLTLLDYMAILGVEFTEGGGAGVAYLAHVEDVDREAAS